MYSEIYANMYNTEYKKHSKFWGAFVLPTMINPRLCRGNDKAFSYEQSNKKPTRTWYNILSLTAKNIKHERSWLYEKFIHE